MIDFYIGSPYNRILDIVEMRIDADDVTMGIYDAMVDVNFGGEREWILEREIARVARRKSVVKSI